MTNADDKAYFTMRAERERALACSAENKTIAQIHLTMAQAYDRLLQPEEASADILPFQQPR